MRSNRGKLWKSRCFPLLPREFYISLCLCSLPMRYEPFQQSLLKMNPIAVSFNSPSGTPRSSSERSWAVLWSHLPTRLEAVQWARVLSWGLSLYTSQCFLLLAQENLKRSMWIGVCPISPWNWEEAGHTLAHLHCKNIQSHPIRWV